MGIVPVVSVPTRIGFNLKRSVGAGAEARVAVRRCDHGVAESSGSSDTHSLQRLRGGAATPNPTGDSFLSTTGHAIYPSRLETGTTLTVRHRSHCHTLTAPSPSLNGVVPHYPSFWSISWRPRAQTSAASTTTLDRARRIVVTHTFTCKTATSAAPLRWHAMWPSASVRGMAVVTCSMV